MPRPPWRRERKQKSCLEASLEDFCFLSRRQGGLGILHPKLHTQALQAHWLFRFVTQDPAPPWANALRYALRHLPHGIFSLASPLTQRQFDSIPQCWRHLIRSWRSEERRVG